MELWCVNIQGPDDVIAVASRLDAIDYAARFNAWWLTRVEADGLHEYDPTMWAVPTHWPHNADSHAKNLSDLGEYAWLQGLPPTFVTRPVEKQFG